jgi:hypothetical protein
MKTCYGAAMTKDQVKGGDDIIDDEWKIIEERTERRELASDEEVEALFGRYRSA